MELVKGVRSTTRRTSRSSATRSSKNVPTRTAGTKFLYHGRILVDGGEGFDRRWLVTVRREGDAYRVANYQELAE
jgi:hypothetical protein